MFDWLKAYLPRGLYSRAALILVVPVVTLQLAVTIAFLQRHFEAVTFQLTRAVAIEVAVLRDSLAQYPEAMREEAVEGLADRLDFELRAAVDPPLASRRVFYDISGRTVERTLRGNLPGFLSVDLASSSRRAVIHVDTVAGPMALTVARARLSASNPHQLVVITLFVGALMSLVSFVFLRNQLKPIKRLAETAEAFGKGRTLPYRPAGALEVRAAGRAFLDMRARIERQIEQRTLLLSGVSHDMRTPLTRMRLELSLLEPSAETEALGRDIAEMEVLLQAFLDFSRGVGSEAMEPTDPVELSAQSVEKARRTGGHVVLRPVAHPPGMVALRPLSMARALDNLIGNALRYADRAEVSVTLKDGTLVVCVEDDGPGIPPERREEALRPFARLDRSRNQDRGSGVGLGLAIVADVARSHGGRLVLDHSARLGGLSACVIVPA